MKKKPKNCSFCNKPKAETFCLVIKDNVAICDVCIDMARDIVGTKRVTSK